MNEDDCIAGFRTMALLIIHERRFIRQRDKFVFDVLNAGISLIPTVVDDLSSAKFGFRPQPWGVAPGCTVTVNSIAWQCTLGDKYSSLPFLRRGVELRGFS